MSARVVWSEPALDDLARLDQHVARQFERALRRLAETGHGDVSRLPPPQEGYRLRVRDWRVLLYFDNAGSTITVHAIEHRSRVYRQL